MSNYCPKKLDHCHHLAAAVLSILLLAGMHGGLFVLLCCTRCCYGPPRHELWNVVLVQRRAIMPATSAGRQCVTISVTQSMLDSYAGWTMPSAMVNVEALAKACHSTNHVHDSVCMGVSALACHNQAQNLPRATKAAAFVQDMWASFARECFD